MLIKTRQVLYILAILAVIAGSAPARAGSPYYDTFVKICRDYRSGEGRNCTPVPELQVGGSFLRMHAYIEFNWKVPRPERPESPVYFRWEFLPPGEEPVLLSGHRTNEDYKTVPRTWNDPTRWVVSQRVWPERVGVYRFYVFTNPTDLTGSLLGSTDVAVVEGAGS